MHVSKSFRTQHLNKFVTLGTGDDDNDVGSTRDHVIFPDKQQIAYAAGSSADLYHDYRGTLLRTMFVPIIIRLTP